MAKKMADRYNSFRQLERDEIKGIDYEVLFERRESPIAIIAPHGGEIEPHTSTIARAIAADTYNFYSFSGLKQNRPHHELHITSHNFDEPHCVVIVQGCDIVVAIHGRKNRHDPKSAYLGGLNTKLKNHVSIALKNAGFPARTDSHPFPARQAANICNKGLRKRGVQLELPLTLRRELANDPTKLNHFSNAVRKAIEDNC